MRFNQLIRDYFTFSRNERKGIIILISIIFVLAIANKLIIFSAKPPSINKNLLDSARNKLAIRNDSLNNKVKSRTLFPFNPNTITPSAMDTLDLPDLVKYNLIKFRDQGGRFKSRIDFKKVYGVDEQLYSTLSSYLFVSNDSANLTAEPTLFSFDPNNVGDADLKRLGFSDRQVGAIRKYIASGVRFKTKEDFFRIRIITDRQKEILSSWILIPKSVEYSVNPDKKAEKEVIAINSSDSIALKQLPGIGAVLSKRIIKYRDLLGGFYSLNQLAEVYGLPDATRQQIIKLLKIDSAYIKKIDLKFSDQKELSKHPYIGKSLASKIIRFRSTYGSIDNPKVLRDSLVLNDVEFEKLKPYLMH